MNKNELNYFDCNRKDCLDNCNSICLSTYDNCTYNDKCINFRKQLFVNNNVIYRNDNRRKI